MKKRKNKGFIAYLVIIIYLLCLGAAGLSFLSAGFITEMRSLITRSVIFDNGSFSKNAESISVALNKGETVKLSGFSALRSADLSGSEDYKEISDWADANPQVDVTYSVTLPDGSVVSSRSELVDFSGLSSDTLPLYASDIALFKNVKTVDLGSDALSSLSPGDIGYLQELYPQVVFSYKLHLGAAEANLTDTELDLRSLSAQELPESLLWLERMKYLRSIELGSEEDCALDLSDIAKIADACPDVRLGYSFTLYGFPITLDAEEINLSHIPVTDGGEAVEAALRCMKGCRKLDMDYCGVDDSRMEELRDMFPEVEVIWRIWFGSCYSVRTDTERILASRPSVGGMLDNSVGEKLKYCTKLKYLDLGHNDALTDISFVRYMPELEVFIIAINTGITDISPLAGCKKLEYLEINSTPVSDLSPLAGLDSLHHVNIGCTQVRDISPLYNCRDMERLWIGLYTEVPAEQLAQMQSAAPNCVINTTTDDPHGENWRWDYYDDSMFVYHYVPRYDLLRTQLGYTYSEYSYYWKDPLCGDPCPPQYVGTSPDGIIEKPQDA